MPVRLPHGPLTLSVSLASLSSSRASQLSLPNQRSIATPTPPIGFRSVPPSLHAAATAVPTSAHGFPTEDDAGTSTVTSPQTGLPTGPCTDGL